MATTYETVLLPDLGPLLDLDGLVPAMAEDALMPGLPGSSRREPGVMTIETKEFQRMMDIVAAAHLFLKEDGTLDRLERAYDRYTAFCESPAHAAAHGRAMDAPDTAAVGGKGGIPS